MKDSRFDIDLRFGQQGEALVHRILTGDTAEVKTERDLWVTTGNIAIEYRCNGVDSGIAVTKSDYWVINLTKDSVEHGVIAIPTARLKAKLREMWPNLRRARGGDGNRAEMVLFPLSRIHELLSP